MPTVTVTAEVDLDEVLDDIDTETLIERLKSRGWQNRHLAAPDRAGIAQEIRSAFYAGNANRLEDLLREIEPASNRSPPARTAVAWFPGAAP